MKLHHWNEHLNFVMNIRSPYQKQVINEVSDSPIDESLDADGEVLEIWQSRGVSRVEYSFSGDIDKYY